jgi:hypothetical protein
MRRSVSTLLFGTLLAMTPLPSDAQVAPATQPAATQPGQAELEKVFAERMSNCVMTGQYTVGNRGPRSDKYTIVSVRKLQGESWLFTARVQFGEKDVTIPMIIPIKWAGDTPVISVTNLWFPGLGTYSARVLIYDNQYAGTWSSAGPNAHGGQMWGRIEKAPATQPATTQRVPVKANPL